MSWSVLAIGKAPAVRAEIAKQFANASKCVEPEETLRQGAAQLIDASLEAQASHSDVRVAASGSQYSDYPSAYPLKGLKNQLTIAIDFLQDEPEAETKKAETNVTQETPVAA